MPVGIDQWVPWDPQDADPRDAEVDQRLGPDDGAPEFGREAQESEQAATVFEVNTNEVVFDAPSGYGNVLEGVGVTYAADRREVYAAGSLTEDIAAVELAHNHVGRSWSLGVPEQDYAKKLRYGDGTLWCVHLDGDDLFATTVPSSKAWHTFASGSFAELCNLEFFQSRPALGIKRPVTLAEAVPDNGDLFVVVVYDPAMETQPETLTADNRYEISSRRLLHLRFENDNRIHVLGDFEAATKHVEPDPRREWLEEHLPWLDELFEPPTVDSVESIIDMAWLEQYEAGVEGVEGGALVLLVHDKQPGTNDILEQKLVLYRYQNDSELSTSGEEHILPPVSEIGVASQVAASRAGLVHVATNPIWVENEVGDKVVPGHLVGYTLMHPLFCEQYRTELTQLADVKGLACNKHTGRLAVLHDRFYCPARVPQQQFDQYDHAGHAIPPYLSWADVYTPDLVAHTASHDASASVGIQSKDVVAIDGEYDVDEHEFVVASAGAAMLVLLPNVDRVGMASEVVSVDQSGDAVSQQYSLGSGTPTVEVVDPVLADGLDPNFMLAGGVEEGIPVVGDDGFTPIVPPLQLLGAVGEGEFTPYAGSGTAPWLVCPEIQVGTAPYMMLFSHKYPDRLLVLSRLGGCQILMLQIPEEDAELPDLANPVLKHALGLTLLDSFHGVNQVGYWPCGMTQSESGDYIYVLSHFDRKLRILDAAAMRTASMDNDPSILVGLVDLPARTRLQNPDKTVEDAVTATLENEGTPPAEFQGDGFVPFGDTAHVNPDYQYFDVLSELTTTDDGMYQLVLLGEVGELHLIRSDAGQSEVVISTTLLPVAVNEPRGPGRMQGVFEEWGHLGVTLWVYVKQYPHLRNMYENIIAPTPRPRPEVFNALVQIKVHRILASPLFETEVFNLDRRYQVFTGDENADLVIQDPDPLGRHINPRRLVFFSRQTQEIFVGRSVWRFDEADQTVVFQRYVVDEHNEVVANRIIDEDDDGGLYGEYYADSPANTHLVRRLLLTGNNYLIDEEYSLGEYFQMKPQIALRTSELGLHAATAQPTHALVEIEALE